MKVPFSVGFFNPDNLNLADGVVRPEREGVFADYLDLNGPAGLIFLLVVSLLIRVNSQPIEENEDSVPVKGRGSGKRQHLMRDENLVGPHPLILPVFSQLVRGDPMGGIMVVDAATEFLTEQRVAQVPEVGQVRGEVVLLLLRHDGQFSLNLFQGHTDFNLSGTTSEDKARIEARRRGGRPVC